MLKRCPIYTKMPIDSDISEPSKRDNLKKHKRKDNLDVKKRVSSARRNRRAKLEQQRHQALDNSSSTTITTVLSDLGEGLFIDSPIKENESDADDILSSMTEITLAPPPLKTISNRQYVEQKDNRKFSTYDIEDAYYEEDQQLRNDNDKPVKAAVAVQGCFRPLAGLCCGLLGGVSLWQCLTMRQWSSPFSDSFMDFIPDSIHYLQSVFYLLGTISLISTLDSCDLGELNGSNFLCCYPCKKAPLFIGSILVLTLIASLIGAPLDEQLALSLYNNRSINYNFSSDLIAWEIEWWETMNAVRCVGGILAWILFSLFLGSDTLQNHLINLIGISKQKEEAAKKSEEESNAVK